MITRSELRELLDYDPETGIFRWKVDRNGFVKAGDVAGTKRPGGYIWISIHNKHYAAHRLAWLWMKGNLPHNGLDHKNGDDCDNRWINLRYATKSQNAQNSKIKATNRCGLKGVHFHSDRNKWQAAIFAKGRRIHLGTFNCPTAAHLAYCRAAKKHFGEFARFG